jgi:hypothetical protein
MSGDGVHVITDRKSLVRRAYEAWSFYGVERFECFLSGQVVLEDAPDLPDARLTQGRTEVGRRLEEVSSSVGGGWVEIRGVEEIDGAVRVAMRWKLDTKSGLEIELVELFHLVEVVGAKIARIRVFLAGTRDKSAPSGWSKPRLLVG